MDSERGERPVVLVVEDETDLATLYTEWLSDSYDVVTAHDGEQALELFDESVDVVLLDRMLPSMPGDEILAEIRSQSSDVQVAMVTAVEPDFDILEMGFDDYVTKPIKRGDIAAVVTKLLALRSTNREVQQYFSDVAKRDALEAEKVQDELAASEEYADLLASIDAFRAKVLKLAEESLQTPQRSTESERIYQKQVQKWRQRQADVAETDPLYRAAEAEISKYEQLISEESGGWDAETRLLEHVAEGFVAEGFWLDARVRKALNRIFFDKHTETFVVERQRLAPDADLEPGTLFEVSQAVRRRARANLDG